MKKLMIRVVMLPLVCLFATSCQKESAPFIEPDTTATDQLSSKAAGSCRLSTYDYYDAIADIHNIDQFTYTNGLLDNVLVSYGLRFNMEYDKNKKLIGSKVYDGSTLINTISFTYAGNKLVSEHWLDAVTQDLYDEVFYTYNQQGNLLRNESFILEYYTTYTYTVNGSLASWTLYDLGQPFVKAEYSYGSKYKNAFAAIPGIDYSFWYSNPGFGRGMGTSWYSSEKVTFYDENGEPFVYYDLDPANTTWVLGQQNYPLHADYRDKLSQASFSTAFEYENCIPGQTSLADRVKQNRFKKNNGRVKTILHAPAADLFQN